MCQSKSQSSSHEIIKQLSSKKSPTAGFESLIPLLNLTICDPDFHHPHIKNTSPGTPSQNSRERYHGRILPSMR